MDRNHCLQILEGGGGVGLGRAGVEPSGNVLAGLVYVVVWGWVLVMVLVGVWGSSVRGGRRAPWLLLRR